MSIAEFNYDFVLIRKKELSTKILFLGSRKKQLGTLLVKQKST